MKIVYFVRHGQCQANVERRIAGHNDSPLTDTGRAQADACAALLLDKQIDLILTSPLMRAKDTAERIAKKMGYRGEIRVEPLIIERDFGSINNELKEIGFPLLDAGKVPDAESLEQMADRTTKALEVLKTLPGRYILVVGHGGAERMLHVLYESRHYSTFLDGRSLYNGEIREYTF
jgi:broad specificity phosphatase PhoE